jgi:hypothetical protein
MPALPLPLAAEFLRDEPGSFPPLGEANAEFVGKKSDD